MEKRTLVTGTPWVRSRAAVMFVSGIGVGAATLALCHSVLGSKHVKIGERAGRCGTRDSVPEPGDIGSSAARTDPRVGEILAGLVQGSGASVPAFSVTRLGLDPCEALLLFDGLLSECIRDHNGNRPEAIAWLAARLAEGGDDTFMAVLAGEAITDAETLRQTEEILDRLGGKYGYGFAKGVLNQFAIQDPKKGFAWLLESKDRFDGPKMSSLSLAFAGYVVDGLVTKDTSEALATLGAMNCPEGVGTPVRRAYFEKMARTDADGLWRAVAMPGAPQELLEDAIEALVSADPAASAKRLATAPIKGDGRLKSEKTLIWAWGQSAPERVFEWISQNRPSLQSSAPMAPLFEQWARRDSLQASAALGRLSPGSDRDDAISGLVLGLHSVEPGAAMEWLGQIADEEKRRAVEKQLSK